MAVINRDALRLVWGMARHGAPDADSLAVVNGVAQTMNAFLDALEAGAKEQAAKQAQAQASNPPAPKSAVEEHGIDSPQAQAKRDVRRARRLAGEAAKAGETGGPADPDAVPAPT